MILHIMKGSSLHCSSLHWVHMTAPNRLEHVGCNWLDDLVLVNDYALSCNLNIVHQTERWVLLQEFNKFLGISFSIDVQSITIPTIVCVNNFAFATSKFIFNFLVVEELGKNDRSFLCKGSSTLVTLQLIKKDSWFTEFCYVNNLNSFCELCISYKICYSILELECGFCEDKLFKNLVSIN